MFEIDARFQGARKGGTIATALAVPAATSLYYLDEFNSIVALDL